ncbi:MAG: hypothetical protein ACD_24C00080G0001 [uncultured bacterium]|nr:MAG: hypothetical protein ACD_24C00080G0001 [uncultured bacterium]
MYVIPFTVAGPVTSRSSFITCVSIVTIPLTGLISIGSILMARLYDFMKLSTEVGKSGEVFASLAYHLSTFKYFPYGNGGAPNV